MQLNLNNLTMLAHHKGGGSSANGRDSAGRRLGTKRADGQDINHLPSTRYAHLPRCKRWSWKR